MNDTNKKIIQMIEQNLSMKEIASILNISEKQLYVRIKQIINYGYSLKENYRYDSDINYEIIEGKHLEPSNKVKINLPNKTNLFRCLVISDLHIGDKDSNIDLVNYVYDYAKCEGITYILICGDNIEGEYTSSKKTINNVYDQIETLIKKYPYDKDIKNIMIFGNHDQHSFNFNGLDVSRTIKNSRYDIIPLGYGQGNVNIKKDNLVLFHKLKNKDKPVLEYNEKIILSGHGHLMKSKVRDRLWLCVPTLSNVSVDKTKQILPSFLELDIDMIRGKFDYVEAKQLIITPKIYEVSQTRCKLKVFKNNNIKE